MKKIILIAAALFSIYFAAAQTTEQQYENYISVTGTSEREITPNEIYVQITLRESDTKGKTSLDKLERDMIATLSAIGVDVEKQLQVSDMTNDLQSYILRKNQVLSTKNYTLKLPDAATTAIVFMELSQMGIYGLGITKTTHSDLENIKMEMRVEAMQKARHTAQTLAEAVGQTAGRAVFISDTNNFYAPTARVMYANADMITAESADYQPVLEFQDLKMTYTVYVKFVLE